MYKKILKLSLLSGLVSMSLFVHAQQLNNINKPSKTVPNMAPMAVPKPQFQTSTTTWPVGPGGNTPIVIAGPGTGACTAKTVTWGNNACSGNVGAGTQMQNASVVNTKAEATGTGNFSCVNGNWVPAAGSTCEPTQRTCELFSIGYGQPTKVSESTIGYTTTAQLTYTPAVSGSNTVLYKTSIPHSENTIRGVMCAPGTPAQMETAYKAMVNKTGKGLWGHQTYDASQGYGANSGYGFSMCSMGMSLGGCGFFTVTGSIGANGVHNLTCTYTAGDCGGGGG